MTYTAQGADPATGPSPRLDQVRAGIAAACEAAGRAPAAVTLIAVSKTRSVGEIRNLACLGVSDFGENYVQEALPKIGALAGTGLRWHLIGPLQSNKTRDAAAHFDWVHSIDRGKIARRLDEQRPPGLPPLDVCIQVNVDDEDSKSGVAAGEAAALAREILALSRLRLRGLMTIPRPDQPDAPHDAYARLAALHRELAATIPGLGAGSCFDTLSMGMSDDYALAIARGATAVRIGTALFGPRPARPGTPPAGGEPVEESR